MASFATLNIIDAVAPATIAAPFVQKSAPIDWAREYPEEQFVRLASGWRMIVVAGGALATWVIVGGTVLSLVRGFGMI